MREDMVQVAVGLDRDIRRQAQAPHWVEISRRALAQVRYDRENTIRPEAIAARRAFDLAAVGQAGDAVQRMNEAVNGTSDRALRGLLMEQKAAYLHLVDAAAAQQALAGALRENEFVVRPVSGVRPAQIKSVPAQARAAAEFLADRYTDRGGLVLGVRAMLDEIVWDDKRTDDAEAAWELLGRHLGFHSVRPEKMYGTGPDNLWVLSNTLHAVVELKTGCETDTIAKKDLDQLGGSVRWDLGHYPDVRQLSVMVHPSRRAHEKGILVEGMRVVTAETLDARKKAVTAYAIALSDGVARWRQEPAVLEQLTHHRLTAAHLFNTYAENARPWR